MSQIHVLSGLVITDWQQSNDELTLFIREGEFKKVNFYHVQDCCESVMIHSVEGEFSNLLNCPLILVDEDAHSNSLDSEAEGESWTWTIYTFKTEKGTVVVKWIGNSNGYYSESVNMRITKTDGTVANY